MTEKDTSEKFAELGKSLSEAFGNAAQALADFFAAFTQKDEKENN